MNVNSQNDRLEKLIANYEREIETKERELASLKAKLSNLRMFERAAEILENPQAEPDKYANTGATQAILDALGSIYPTGVKDKRGATAREISDYMVAHGFQPKTIGQTFHVAVSVTLRRLAEARRVHKFSEGDGNFYKPVGKVYSAVKK
jgi:hypothetical protein